MGPGHTIRAGLLTLWSLFMQMNSRLMQMGEMEGLFRWSGPAFHGVQRLSRTNLQGSHLFQHSVHRCRIPRVPFWTLTVLRGRTSVHGPEIPLLHHFVFLGFILYCMVLKTVRLKWMFEDTENMKRAVKTGRGTLLILRLLVSCVSCDMRDPKGHWF